MNDHGSVSFWMLALKEGDELAAQKLWEVYWPRLIVLARKKLSGNRFRVFDEEDVVQSAMNSFFQRAEQGRFPDIRDRSELWSLLVTITARKAINRQRHALRAKRGAMLVKNEGSFECSDTDSPLLANVVGNEPTPEFAASFVETLQSLMDRLTDRRHQDIVLCKLEGRTNREIAQHLDCSLSAVERKLRIVRTLLEPRDSEV